MTKIQFQNLNQTSVSNLEPLTKVQFIIVSELSNIATVRPAISIEYPSSLARVTSIKSQKQSRQNLSLKILTKLQFQNSTKLQPQNHDQNSVSKAWLKFRLKNNNLKTLQLSPELNYQHCFSKIID